MHLHVKQHIQIHFFIAGEELTTCTPQKGKFLKLFSHFINSFSLKWKIKMLDMYVAPKDLAVFLTVHVYPSFNCGKCLTLSNQIWLAKLI